MKKLPRSFYDRDTIRVAQEILGMHLVHRNGNIERIGRIVETEAYLGEHDLAAHSAKGRTPRTEIMFGPPGHAYVYLIYGMYHCLNIVTEKEGHASAVLIRALEPIQNCDGRTSGPGLLCNAMHITKACNGQDLLSDELFLIEPFPKPILRQTQDKIFITKRPRVGVDYARHWAKRLLRFSIRGNAWVSRK